MKQKGIQKTITYLYYTLFFVTPFIVLPITSELFEFNKIIFIYAIAGLIFSLWVVDCLRKGSIIWKHTPFDIPLVLFYISQLISFIFSIDRHTSFFGYYGRFNGGLLSISVYIFLYYAFIFYVSHNKGAVRRIFGLIITACIMVFLWGLPGIVNRDLSCLLFVGTFDNSCWTAQFRPAERMFSTLGQPNWLGAYSAVGFFTALYLLITTKRKSIVVLSCVALLSTFCAILFSRSRSSLASLVPGLLLFLLSFAVLKMHIIQLVESKKSYIAVTFFALIVALFSIKTGITSIDSILSFQFSKKNTPTLINQNNAQVDASEESTAIQIGGVTESLDIRKIVWQGAIDLGLQYPLFGTGLETFGYAYYSVRPQEHNLTSEWDYLYNKAHNELLHIFSTSGWFGLITYSLLIFWIVGRILYSLLFSKDSHISEKLQYVFLFSVFISILVTNFFGFSTTTINLFWFILPGVLLTGRYHVPITPSHNPVSIKQWFLGLIIYIVILNYLISYWYADYLYAQSDALAKNGAAESSVILLDKARSLRYEHVFDDKMSYLLAQIAFSQINSTRAETIPQLIAKADELNISSIKDSKNNVLYWKTRVKNQYLFYQATLNKKHLFTGLSALDEAKILAPTDPKIPYFASTYYTLLYDEEQNKEQKQIYLQQSLEEINKAIDLKNNYLDAYTLKIQLLKKYQLKTELKSFLEFYLRNIAPDDQTAKSEYEAL